MISPVAFPALESEALQIFLKSKSSGLVFFIHVKQHGNQMTQLASTLIVCLIVLLTFHHLIKSFKFTVGIAILQFYCNEVLHQPAFPVLIVYTTNSFSRLKPC